MAEIDRLQRLCADEVEACRVGGADDRLAELEALKAGIPDTEGDRKLLSALAGETRHRIVRLLAAADRELCVCEIDLLLDVSDSAVSHALAALADAGLVSRRRSGRWRYYRSTPVAERLLAVLDEVRT